MLPEGQEWCETGDDARCSHDFPEVKGRESPVCSQVGGGLTWWIANRGGTADSAQRYK